MHPFGRWLPLAWRIIKHPLPRYLACWGLLLYTGYRLTDGALKSWDSEEHPAGTTGHCTVDFGGQWFTGKLLLRGEGRYLYERRHIWSVLHEAWPPDTRVLVGNEIDTKRFAKWLSGQEVDNKAPELLCCYLLPMGASNGIEAASSFVGALQAEEKNRFDYGEGLRLKDADWLLWWLVCVGEGKIDVINSDGTKTEGVKVDGTKYETEVANTNATCLLPLASQDPFGVAALTVAGQQHAWTSNKIEQASHRIVGGQLYPPIHAFLYVPLALLDPPVAYRVAIILPVAFALLAGLGLSRVTGGGVWWPIGTLLTITFPHFVDAQALGHNGAIIVAITVWGYYFLQKNAEIRGGIVWGMLAYKPSWAFIYFVMLLVSRRWLAAFAMGTCAVVQILLTLPFVGVHSWLEWRRVLTTAAPGYGIYQNWVNVSRDMFTYPRRALTDWTAAEEFRDVFESRLIGFILIGIVLEITVRLTTLRGRHSKHWSYSAGAFLLLGFWMCCLHITYYDTIFATLPVALLLMVPTQVFVPYFFRRARLAWNAPGRETLTLPERNYGWACNPLIIYVLPLIIWNPWGQVFVNTLGEYVGWNFTDLVDTVAGDSTEYASKLRRWLDQPLIVALYATLWLWAGWNWLRENGSGVSPFPSASSTSPHT